MLPKIYAAKTAGFMQDLPNRFTYLAVDVRYKLMSARVRPKDRDKQENSISLNIRPSEVAAFNKSTTRPRQSSQLLPNVEGETTPPKKWGMSALQTCEFEHAALSD